MSDNPPLLSSTLFTMFTSNTSLGTKLLRFTDGLQSSKDPISGRKGIVNT